MLPVLQELLGEPKWGHAHPALPEELRRRIRLDHDNIHYQGPVAEGDKPARGNHLHGGPAAHHITAVFELKSVGRGDGGFGCCPGTQMPAGLAKAEGMGVENWKTEWCDTVRLPHRPQAHGHTKLTSMGISPGASRIRGGATTCRRTASRGRPATACCSPRSSATARSLGPARASGGPSSVRPRTTSFAPRATAAFWDLTLLRTSDKYVPYGMHHSDVGYDTTDPELTSQQRDILEFSGSWFNLPTQPNRHECADQNPIAKTVLARRCQAPSQAAACGGRPGANVEYGATNPALTQLHPLATTPVDSATVDMVPGWAGPRDNVHGAR